jgi:hypothetical protein
VAVTTLTEGGDGVRLKGEIRKGRLQLALRPMEPVRIEKVRVAQASSLCHG